MKQLQLKDGSFHTFTGMEIMGIINVTPDSFFAGSRTFGVDAALERADEMVAQGATFLDIGGESTRPGSAAVEIEEEIRRVCPVIKEIKKRHPEVLLSVDTYNAETAKAAIEAGVDIINDISGLTFDENMASVIAEAGVPVIIMHTGGRPDVMQKDPHYDDVVEEVHEYLERQIQVALEAGIGKNQIIIDLGIGFGKTYEHNITLLQNLHRFDDFGMPHLLAVSRKTFIGKALDESDPADRLFGTVAVTLFAARHGLELARVHDVKPNADALKMTSILENKTTTAIIALGSNLGDCQKNLDVALDKLETRVGHITGCSSVLETEAYGNTDQPNFLNMAVKLETTLTAAETMEALLDIEQEQGRRRTSHWGPRTLDLDIVYFGQQILTTDQLTIPHPDLHNRDFVLQPVTEIAPNFVDPLRGKTVQTLLEELQQANQ